ncbi:gene transfer agent family protein [Mesorhizobium sp. NBSH29]|uniref:gene transfer agent family protein n=1 Tax=Mesorhizobium sp. NBSH29 TaxID=2654249 RepID=UPI001896A330|nr:gene transfer agent family protein [Mesorhizobium sp. NBSH29]QPC87217.1 gene transfer agent family protein [Mesorhizobium sp. NBSH29]
MIANRHRGEIAAELDGKPYRLCLTLGALAELEAVYAADDLAALVERFSTGRLSATDIIRVIGAGLRGAGAAISDAEVAAMHAPGGAAGFATLVSDLLSATFGAAGEAGLAGKNL